MTIRPFKQRQRQQGFTIIELMIATLVFSVILLIITSGILSFTKSYYRGVNSSTLQNTVRSISDSLSQAILFSGQTVEATTTHPNYFCTGGKVYAFVPGQLYTGGTPSAMNTGLYSEDETIGSCNAPVVPGTNGSELLGPNMRIVKLTVTSFTTNGQVLWNISLRIAYGADDLLCSPSLSGSCSPGASTLSTAQLNSSSDLQCRPDEGSQFCAVSELSTAVQQRII